MITAAPLLCVEFSLKSKQPVFACNIYSVPSTSGGNEPLHGYSQYVHSDGDSQPRTIGTIPDIVIHPSFLSTNVIFVAEVS